MGTTDVEKLLVRLEVTQRRFERQLQTANRTADRRAKAIEARFTRMNQSIDRSFERIGRSASSAFRTVSRLALIAAGGLSTRQVAKYADAWVSAGNKIRAAEQISGQTARSQSELNDIANETRSGLEQTVDLYTRMLRASGNLGASEEQVAQATETVAKAFKAGGAAASEQAAGVLQLSQALSSGFLQGDELRSLRENAPLIAQAIADEFNTTIGGLKKLGAEGELTASRVFKAILKSQGEINAAFGKTVPTISDGFTALKNGAIEFVGAFNEGSKATDGLSGGLQDLGKFLSDSTAAAERFGAQVAEAFKVIGEAFSAIKGDFDFGEIVDDAGNVAINVISIFADLAQAVTATVSGVAAAARQAFINALAAVGDGGIAIANSTIATVEKILQGLLNGVQAVLDGINAVIRKANELPGVDLPTFGELAPVKLGRISSTEIRSQVKPISDAFVEAANDASAAWQQWEDNAVGAIRRIQDAGKKKTEKDGSSEKSSASPPPPPPPTSSGGGSKSHGRGFFDSIEKQKAQLQAQIEGVRLTKGELAELEARYELLAEAKRRGLDLDKVQIETGTTLRQQIDEQAAAIGRLVAKKEQLTKQTEFFNQQQQALKDGLVDAIVEGENFVGVLADVAKAIAKAALQAALFGDGPMAGLFGQTPGIGILSGLLPFRAGGGGVQAGQPYMVNENTPNSEVFVPSQSGAILNVDQAQRALRGTMGRQATPQVSVQPAGVKVVVIDDPDKIGEFMSGPQGEQIMVTTMQRNREAFGA